MVFFPFTDKKIQFQKTTEEKCKGITATTTKYEITATLTTDWTCEGTGLVQGVDTANYKVKGCTGVPFAGQPLPYTNSYCVADGTCAVKTGGTNADCAPKTTATTCTAGSAEGNDGKTANDCVFTNVNSKKFTCNKEKTQVTISSYTGALCQEPVKNAYVFKSNDGICHATDTVQPKPKASPSPAPKASPSPAPKASGDSTNALATGFAVAGLIVSLVLM